MIYSFHSSTNKNDDYKITNSSKIYKLLILISDHTGLLKRANIVSKILTIMLFKISLKSVKKSTNSRFLSLIMQAPLKELIIFTKFLR